MDANFVKLKNCEVVQIKINNVSKTKFSFENIENIRGKKVIAIESFLVADVAKSPLGDALCNATAFQKCFLTLFADGKEKIKDLPVPSIVTKNNNGLLKTLDNFEIVPTKSYIQFAETSGLVLNECLLFAFWYE